MAGQRSDNSNTERRVERDLIALGIAIAAIIMFVGTGSSVLPQIVRSWAFGSSGPDHLLVNALLLNIALIVFGMRRYRELMQEIDERRKAEKKARQLAETDDLTGCLNRRSIAPAANALIAENKGEFLSTACLIIDLDEFKQVNDLNGHQVGDKVLKKTVQRMREAMPGDALLARLGGDEFACVVRHDPADNDLIEHLAERIIAAVSAPMTVDGHPIQISMSVGISSCAQGDPTQASECAAETLMHRADIAMYHSKKAGKGKFSWFEETMESELRFRNELERGIRRGVEKGEFVPYYEQQIDLQSGELTGFEMLARWKSPELGLVGPGVFIPVAEDIGLIAEMSEKLISQALDDATEWDPSLTLSVNVSPIQLRDPWFAQKLLKLLVEKNFPANRLGVEITESCLHENLGVVRTLIASLKNQGVHVSLDDFGTGYSSLSQLRTLPFDGLKIDRSFVSELSKEEDSESIINAIISLGNGLKLPITAEGIEDNEILDVLRKKGQLKGQGYLYGQPEDAAAVRKRLGREGLLSEKGSPKDASIPSVEKDAAATGRKTA